MDNFETGRRDPRPIHYLAAALFVVVVTILHYTTAKTAVHLHTLYRELYFAPIIYLSIRFGLRAGLTTAGIVTLFYLPHIYMTWQAQPGVNLGNILQVPVFLLVAALLGGLSDREQERQRRLRKAESIASLGRASMTLAGELQDIIVQIKQSIASKPQLQEHLSELDDAVDKIVILEDALRQFSPEQAAPPSGFVEMDQLLTLIDKNLLKSAANKNVAIKTRPGAAHAMIMGKQKDLVWTIEQLIRNAVDVSTPGNEVVLATERDDKECVLHISDHGPGIPAENLARIFIPFYTTKKKGTGLGLAVCKKIVKENSGEILVESAPGKGTTFTLRFPRAFTLRTSHERAQEVARATG